MEAFRACVRDGKERQLIEQQMKVARELGARGTPAFFVGIVQADGSVTVKKRINGAQPFSEFRTAIMDVVPLNLRAVASADRMVTGSDK